MGVNRGVMLAATYEQYIIGLICFRNELEGLVESSPQGGGYHLLPASASPRQDAERQMARLHAVMRDYSENSLRWSQRGTLEWTAGLDEEVTERPAGLPAMPADGKQEEILLGQVEQLMEELSERGVFTELTSLELRH